MKRMLINELVRWAYRDELPKDGATTFLRPDGFGFGWGSVAKFAKYGAEVDEPDIRNRFGLAPDFTAQTQPHEDAVRVWIAVQGLNELTLSIEEDWNPIADLDIHPTYEEAAIDKALDAMCFVPGKPPEATLRSWRSARAARDPGNPMLLRRSVSDLIQKYAVLGSVPPWEAEKPEFKTVMENGKAKWFIREVIETETGPVEIEANGLDPKRRIPKDGAYLKHYYDPDPSMTVEDRAEYELWHSAMSALTEELVGRLDEHEALPLDIPIRPWETGTKPPPRLLVDMRPRRPIQPVRRPVAGPPLPRGITPETTGKKKRN